MKGQEVMVPEAVWQRSEAATPAQEAATRQRCEDSARGGSFYLFLLLLLSLMMLDGVDH